jgi:hypothetical protein
MKPPDVALIFQGFVIEHGHQYAEILLTNSTVHTVWFTSYSANFPIYRVQHLKEDQWEYRNMGWCGNGLGPRKVGSHKSFKFTVPIE